MATCGSVRRHRVESSAISSAERGLLKVDLHCHTEWSSDCGASVARVLETYRDRGIHCAAITDHNEIEGALRAERLGIIRVIVGEEIMTTQGEIIGLFLTERIPRGLPPLEAVEAIRSQGGIVMAPHPTDRLRGSALRPAALASLAGKLDLVEVFNGRTMLSSDNDAARRFQESSGRIACVGSDAHTEGEIGGCYNEIDEFSGTDDFLSKMASARLVTAKSPFRVHVHSTVAKLRSRLDRRRKIRDEVLRP